MENQRKQTVSEREVNCDGGDSEFGHPKVDLYIKDDKVACPYCGQLYVLCKNKAE